MLPLATIEQDVRVILDGLHPNLLYHNRAHTFEWVYKYSLMLAQEEQLADADIYNIAVAALFHDVGFIKQYAANEPIAVEMLRSYAMTHDLGIRDAQFDMMCDAIMNTNMQSVPTTIYARILRDADMSPQGHVDFPTINAQLRQEALLYPTTYLHTFAQRDALWKHQQLKFMKDHMWFTRSAHRLFEAQKQQNVALVERWRE